MKAKFEVLTVTKGKGFDQIVMTPVLSGSEENKSFSQYTPSGKIDIMITNPTLLGTINPGDVYYINFEKAEK